MTTLKSKKTYTSPNQSAQYDNPNSLVLPPLKLRGIANQMCGVKMITTQAIFIHITYNQKAVLSSHCLQY